MTLFIDDLDLQVRRHRPHRGSPLRETVLNLGLRRYGRCLSHTSNVAHPCTVTVGYLPEIQNFYDVLHQQLRRKRTSDDTCAEAANFI
jgi:hypothetical protein